MQILSAKRTDPFVSYRIARIYDAVYNRLLEAIPRSEISFEGKAKADVKSQARRGEHFEENFNRVIKRQTHF